MENPEVAPTRRLEVRFHTGVTWTCDGVQDLDELFLEMEMGDELFIYERKVEDPEGIRAGVVTDEEGYHVADLIWVQV